MPTPIDREWAEAVIVRIEIAHKYRPNDWHEAVAEELSAFREEIEKDKPIGWPSWKAKAEEMERNWIGATQTHQQERRRADEIEARINEERRCRAMRHALQGRFLRYVR